MSSRRWLQAFCAFSISVGSGLVEGCSADPNVDASVQMGTSLPALSKGQYAEALKALRDTKSLDMDVYYLPPAAEETPVERPPGNVGFGPTCRLANEADVSRLTSLLSALEPMKMSQTGGTYSLKVRASRSGHEVFVADFVFVSPYDRSAQALVNGRVGVFDAVTVQKIYDFVVAKLPKSPTRDVPGTICLP